MNCKFALITGASSGLGADFAWRLAHQGYDLLITARRLERLQDLQQKIEGMFNQSVSVFQADLSNSVGPSSILAEIDRINRPVDFLINNAGYGYAAGVLDKSIDEWEKMIQVNINSLVHLTRQILPSMVAQKQGRIINVASVAAFQAVPWFNVYSAAKAFVLSFTEALAQEVKGSHIKVSCLCPGPTRTEFAHIAGTDTIKPPEFVWMESDEVVRRALQAVEKNKVVCIPGIFNKIQVHGERVLPRHFVSYVAGQIYKP
ncbi:SDR family NAD(P)-dependent oxidoreductase [candidate division CSSED10-310 bacterium]|uniref:SDR family NAD(P)-dependent oxidoreductase n=1 Tax=candidate division CSSED10-310 bacterium TaxID=2855610 RepID=A0ABV6Z2G7_UNCC1